MLAHSQHRQAGAYVAALGTAVLDYCADEPHVSEAQQLKYA